MAKAKNLLTIKNITSVDASGKSKTLRFRFTDTVNTGDEPVWDDTDKLTPEQLQSRIALAYYFYNYYFSVKDLRGILYKYINEVLKLSPDDMRVLNRIPDEMIGITPCSIAMIWSRGCPLPEKTSAWIANHLKNIIERKRPEIVIKKPIFVEDKKSEQLSDIIGELEYNYDLTVHENRKPTETPLEVFKRFKMPTDRISAVSEFFALRETELVKSRIVPGAKDHDPQLHEAYKVIDVKKYKKAISYLTLIKNDLLEYGKKEVKEEKPKTVRKVKPISKEKLVSKLKYLKSDTNLEITSCDPKDMIGCGGLWVYNIKTRKIGYYVPDIGGAISLKGSTLIGWDEEKSISKTLRKPKEKLAEFKSSGKVQLRKFMDGINAVEVKLSGRINEDTLILKAV